MVILDDNEDITPPETVASSVEAVEKPLLDTEEIDQMLKEMQTTQKKQPEQEECINCGKTMSKKSCGLVKVSMIKNPKSDVHGTFLIIFDSPLAPIVEKLPKFGDEI